MINKWQKELWNIDRREKLISSMPGYKIYKMISTKESFSGEDGFDVAIKRRCRSRSRTIKISVHPYQTKLTIGWVLSYWNHVYNVALIVNTQSGMSLLWVVGMILWTYGRYFAFPSPIKSFSQVNQNVSGKEKCGKNTSR